MSKLQLEEKCHSFIERSYVKKDSSKIFGVNKYLWRLFWIILMKVYIILIKQ